MDATIAGAAETPYARRTARSTPELLADAATRALADAGLDPKDVDGLGVASFTLAPDHAVDLAWRLGLRRLSWLMDDATGGASGINLLAHALRAVEAGDARAVLLVAGDALGAASFRNLADAYSSATRDHLAPLPFGGPNALFALLTRRHLRRHDLRREHYGAVVLAQRAWAAGNPDAVYRAPLTMREYLGAPMVSDPLGRLDCVPIVSGADALVVAAARGGVRVRAVAACHVSDGQEGDGLATGLAGAAPGLWERAGLGPRDVDLASVYDDYPVMVLVQLADLGFAEHGVAALVDEIAARRLPVNTSGGQLSAGQAGAAGGMHGLVEAVRQLRGEAGLRQVAGARTALVTGYGMVLYRYGACSGAAVLEAPS